MPIPKQIVQTSRFKLPYFLLDNIKSYSENWEYFHFTDNEAKEFIENYPIEEFTNSLEVFNSFQGAHKADFFRYYFLYIKGGVYMDSDITLETNIENIIKDYSFVSVKSLLNNDSIFNGFIACEPKHDIIYKALCHVHNLDVSLLADYFLICKKLYEIINTCNMNVCILNEEFDEDKEISNTVENNNILFRHNITKKYIQTNIPIKNKTFKPIHNTKIGITFNIPKEAKDLYSNGIRQNVLYLAELFLNIGYDCYLIIKDVKNNINDNNKQIFYTNFKISEFYDILADDFDIVIVMGFQVEWRILETLRRMKTKIVYYLCGNSYIVESEKILYSQHKESSDFVYPTKHDFKLCDEIWCIPQMANTNKYYWQTLYRSKCIEVPFVWSEKSIYLTKTVLNATSIDDFLYKNHNKKLAIMEPNISIMKWALPALLVCENAYRETSQIEHVFITNMLQKESKYNEYNIDSFNKFVKSLDLYSDKKISIEARYSSIAFMKEQANFVVSHQWENALNYLYFDLAWMGWPIIHNAHLCKDVGYYYEGFNYEMGGKILKYAMENHHLNPDYIKKNRQAIDKYLPNNKELQRKYISLINNLY
jgi:hypothetical protein